MKYETPEMKVLLLKAEDVITVSDNGSAGGFGDGDGDGNDTSTDLGDSDF